MSLWDNLDWIDRVSSEQLHSMVINRRGTGKTLGQCMVFIGTAIGNPGTKINLFDVDAPNRQAVRAAVMPIMNGIIRDLGLEGITVDSDNMTVTYSLPKNLSLLKRLLRKGL